VRVVERKQILDACANSIFFVVGDNDD
jgi:hypothetical protein